MPVIVLILFIAVVAGLIYGGMQLYALVSAPAGLAAAVLALLTAAGLLAAPFIWLWKRYVAIHGRKRNGQRVLESELQDGHIHVDALNKRGLLRTGQGERAFIFADIAEAAEQGGAVRLTLRNPDQEWLLVMDRAADRRRWARILTLAARQDL